MASALLSGAPRPSVEGLASAERTEPDSDTRMAKYKLEYLWLDGYEPGPNLRGGTQVKEIYV
jgi:hypothetical protein